ncbi:hypothetical protein NL676_001107 [Syzygium grande]|nr:hypothetical protein NL676_001107 [Syzygium grande]
MGTDRIRAVISTVRMWRRHPELFSARAKQVVCYDIAAKEGEEELPGDRRSEELGMVRTLNGLLRRNVEWCVGNPDWWGDVSGALLPRPRMLMVGSPICSKASSEEKFYSLRGGKLGSLKAFMNPIPHWFPLFSWNQVDLC